MDELLPVEPVRPPSPLRRRTLLVVTLVLIAAFVVVAGLEGSGFIIQPRPAPAVEATLAPKPPTRLAVIGLDAALSSIDASDGSTVDYPAAGGSFGFPAWSPDGTRITAIGTGGQEGILALFTALVDRSATSAALPTILYQSENHPPFYAYWAPDGAAIAFLTTELNGITLRRVPADSSGPDTTIRTGAPMYWQWIDPSSLLVHSGGDAASGFAGEVGLDGSPVGSTTLEAGAFRAPAVSSDGKYLAFATSLQDGSAQVVVEARDGSPATRHAIPVYGTAAIEFDPASDRVAFIAQSIPDVPSNLPIGPLRIVNAATGALRTILDGGVIVFFWSPDGRTIAAIRVPDPTDGNVASLTEPKAVLTRATRATAHGTATADDDISMQLVFVDSATGTIRSRKMIRESVLFGTQVEPYFDQYALSHRFWSPDSQSIVLPIDDDQGASQITVFHADGSDPQVLGHGEFAAWSP